MRKGQGRMEDLLISYSLLMQCCSCTVNVCGYLASDGKTILKTGGEISNGVILTNYSSCLLCSYPESWVLMYSSSYCMQSILWWSQVCPRSQQLTLIYGFPNESQSNGCFRQGEVMSHIWSPPFFFIVSSLLWPPCFIPYYFTNFSLSFSPGSVSTFS